MLSDTDVQKNMLILAVEKIISAWSITSVSTPVRCSMAEMGCQTPLKHLLETFSPMSTKYFNNQEDDSSIGNCNTYSFIKNMSPSTYDLATSAKASKPLPMNSFPNIFHELQSQSLETNQKSEPEQFYPGSMLAGPSKEMMGCMEVESYLNDNGKGQDNNNVNFEGYNEEVLQNSEQQSWNYYNSIMGGESMLPPVMLSNYQDMAMLQQELQQSTWLNQNVLPVFFQPIMVPEDERKSKPRKRKVKVKKEKINTDTNMEENVQNLLALQKASVYQNPSTNEADWTGAQPTDDELLSRCKEAVQTEDTNLNKSHTSMSSMEYLEEAALQLLKDETSAKDNCKPRGRFKCDICGRTFKRQFTLQTHIRIHENVKPFTCEFCGQGFRQSGTKLNHIRAIHTKEKRFQCLYCGKTFSHKSTLTVHIRIHTKEKPFPCEKCNKRFADRATYLKHKPVHTGVRPFQCTQCDKTFAQKSNLKRHLENIHYNPKPSRRKQRDLLKAANKLLARSCI